MVFALGHGQRIDSIFAVLDVDRDALGHERLVIALHIPGLLAADLRRLQRVRNTRPAYNLLESGNFFFVNCIVDQSLAVRAVLRQVLRREAPVIVRSGGHDQRINGVVPILDVNRDALGQQLGIVILQLPDLLAADLRLPRNVGVLDVVAINDSFKSGRHFFFYCVRDFRRAVFTVLRQIPGGEGPLIVTAGGNGHRINDVIAILDVHLDALGHKGLIIALHIPGLLAADVCRFLVVRDLGAGGCRIDCSRCAFVCRYKSVVGFFRNRISDALRKAGGCFLLLIRQFQNYHAVLEVHITVLSLHFLVIQCHGDLVLPSVIGIISAHHALADRQVAFVPCIGKGRNLFLVTNRSGIVVVFRVRKTVNDNFGYLVANACRQVLRCFFLVVMQRERRFIVPEGHIPVGVILHGLSD